MNTVNLAIPRVDVSERAKTTWTRRQQAANEQMDLAIELARLDQEYVDGLIKEWAVWWHGAIKPDLRCKAGFEIRTTVRLSVKRILGRGVQPVVLASDQQREMFIFGMTDAVMRLVRREEDSTEERPGAPDEEIGMRAAAAWAEMTPAERAAALVAARIRF